VTSTEIESRNAVVVIFSAGLLVVAAIAGLLYHRLAIHFGLPTTGGLIVQAILSIGAIPLLLLASLERDPRLFEYIETQLPEVDRLFDLHVRQEVLSDPDASRQS
jgi:hypothetical protein